MLRTAGSLTRLCCVSIKDKNNSHPNMVWHSCSLWWQMSFSEVDVMDIMCQSLQSSINYVHPCTQFPKEKHVYGECILVHVFQAKMELSNLHRLNITEGQECNIQLFLYCSWNGAIVVMTFKKYLVIYLWLCAGVFVAVRWLSSSCVSRSPLVAGAWPSLVCRTQL